MPSNPSCQPPQSRRRDGRTAGGPAGLNDPPPPTATLQRAAAFGPPCPYQRARPRPRLLGRPPRLRSAPGARCAAQPRRRIAGASGGARRPGRREAAAGGPARGRHPVGGTAHARPLLSPLPSPALGGRGAASGQPAQAHAACPAPSRRAAARSRRRPPAPCRRSSLPPPSPEAWGLSAARTPPRAASVTGAPRQRPSRCSALALLLFFLPLLLSACPAALRRTRGEDRDGRPPAAAAAAAMQITLKTLQQQTFRIDIDPEETRGLQSSVTFLAGGKGAVVASRPADGLSSGSGGENGSRCTPAERSESDYRKRKFSLSGIDVPTTPVGASVRTPVPRSMVSKC
ncbi:uncharacterized protein LOC142027143 [Buteo buteo]|uniref:uncharacterized protein LOC142027140 n=1 Tax=Buteo buteo TaxID=30397 RepID=UPI003EB7B2C6